jgi:hypothetical protein
MEPTATVAVAQFHKIHGAVVFCGPIVVFYVSYGDVYQHNAAGAQHRRHTAVRQTDVSIAVSGIAVSEQSFQAAPLFDHAREQFGAPGVESRVESQRSLERDGRGGKMGVRGMKGAAIGKAVFDGNIVPAEYLQWIQVVDDREGIQLMKARSHTAIFDVRQAADVENQLRTAPARR